MDDGKYANLRGIEFLEHAQLEAVELPERSHQMVTITQAEFVTVCPDTLVHRVGRLNIEYQPTRGAIVNPYTLGRYLQSFADVPLHPERIVAIIRKHIEHVVLVDVAVDILIKGRDGIELFCRDTQPFMEVDE